MTKKDIERVEWNGENVVKLHVKVAIDTTTNHI